MRRRLPPTLSDDFVGPGAAFVLLGIVALVTLAAALLHGPALAALGLVGAEVGPMLVQSPTPNYWALYIYLAVVTAAAFALASTRRWRWLAITAVAFGLVWAMAGPRDRPTCSAEPLPRHLRLRPCLTPRGRRALFRPRGAYPGASTGCPRRRSPRTARRRASSSFCNPITIRGADRVRGADCSGGAIAWRSEAAVGAVPAAASSRHSSSSPGRSLMSSHISLRRHSIPDLPRSHRQPISDATSRSVHFSR